MRKILPFIILFFGFVGLNDLTAQETWLKLKTLYTYEDNHTSCTNNVVGSDLYMGLEVEDGQVTAAVFSRYKTSSSSSYSVHLTGEEIKGISLYSDYFDDYWIKQLVLPKRLVLWLLPQLWDIMCHPAKDIKTAEPVPLDYLFETDGLGLEIIVSPSNHLSFGGVRADGTSYEMEMHFDQKRLKKGLGGR